MYVHGRTLASILHSCNSRAHASNSQAQALRGSFECSHFNVNLLASCTVCLLTNHLHSNSAVLQLKCNSYKNTVYINSIHSMFYLFITCFG